MTLNPKFRSSYSDRGARKGPIEALAWVRLGYGRFGDRCKIIASRDRSTVPPAACQQGGTGQRAAIDGFGGWHIYDGIRNGGLLEPPARDNGNYTDRRTYYLPRGLHSAPEGCLSEVIFRRSHKQIA